jgi:predicted Ser/Thr protein kinase
MTPERIAGRYQIESRLGHGGMATVYLATDTELRRPVAVKMLADNLAGDETLRKRFKREARLAAKLDHPNIVQVYDVGEEGDRPYIVMEYVEGDTLADHLDRRGSLPAAERLSVLQQMCEGLGHAHDRGLVHRDIKPQNLLLRSTDGCLKIVDFGIARAAEETRLTQTGRVVGTDRYMAPEQLYDGRISPATDVYACGVVAEETLAGGRPPALTEIIERCLREDPRDRFDDATALGEALTDANGKLPATRPLARGSGGRTAPATRPMARPSGPRQALEAETATLTRRPSRRRPRRVREAAALAALAAVVAAIVFVVGSSGDEDTGGSPQAPVVQPAPELSDPGEQAEAFSRWLREQSR